MWGKRGTSTLAVRDDKLSTRGDEGMCAGELSRLARPGFPKGAGTGTVLHVHTRHLRVVDPTHGNHLLRHAYRACMPKTLTIRYRRCSIPGTVTTTRVQDAGARCLVLHGTFQVFVSILLTFLQIVLWHPEGFDACYTRDGPRLLHPEQEAQQEQHPARRLCGRQ